MCGIITPWAVAFVVSYQPVLVLPWVGRDETQRRRRMTTAPELVVLDRIGLVLLLVAIGWVVRRAGFLTSDGLGSLSRLVVDVAFPALVFTQLVETVDRDALVADWIVAVSGFVLLACSWGLARLVFAPTTAFCVGLPNWIFLPLLIASALYGDDGVLVVLLFNAGAQVALWTVGIATLTGKADLAGLAKNPGLWATVLGIAVAMLAPGELAGPLGLGMEALGMLGATTIPLALAVTGGLLAEVPVRQALRPGKQLAIVVIGRMIVLPLAVWGVLLVFDAAGFVLADRVRVLLLIIAAMPVAASGAVHSRRFGGDADLAARAVLWSTVLSLITVPLLVSFAG